MIGGVAPWFGSKRSLASDIVAEIGPRSAYWEPFCGSCAVLLALRPESAETVNDLHGQLTHCLRVLADPELAEELYRRLAGVVCCEGIWQDARVMVAKSEILAGTRSPDLAAAWLITSWMARNGMGGSRSWASSFGVRYTATGGRNVQRWQHVVASIPDWHQRLRNVCVLQRDALELIARIKDEKGTVIYCDPPYLEEGGEYTHSLDIVQQEELSRLLRRLKRARVLLSYYEDERLASWYPGWTVRRLDTTKMIGARDHIDGGKPPSAAPEILLINGESYVEAPSLWPL